MEFVIGLLSSTGDTIHDPFLGRGTVALQAALMGRCAYGSDINPLARMLTQPRLDSSITQSGIDEALSEIDWSRGKIERGDLSPFFHDATVVQIGALRDYLGREAPLDATKPNPVADWVRMATLSRLTGHSKGFLSGYTLPPNQMSTIAQQRAKNENNNTVPPVRDVASIVSAKSRALLRDGCVPFNDAHQIQVSTAWDTPWIPDASVDLVLTSPPFANVVDYAGQHWLRMWFAGIEAADIAFSHFSSLNDWSCMIRQTLLELVRVVKPGRFIAMEVGEIRGGTVFLEELVWAAALGLPCRRLGVIIHDAEFTKSSNIYGVDNNIRGTNTNRIVLLQRI